MVVYDEGFVLVGELFRLVPKNVFDPFIGMSFDGFDLKAVVGVQKNYIAIFDGIESIRKPFSPRGQARLFVFEPGNWHAVITKKIVKERRLAWKQI